MADEERLIIALEARIAEFEKKMKRAEGIGTRSYTGLRRHSYAATQAMERDMLRSTTAINRALAQTSTKIGTLGKTMVAGLGAGLVAAAAAGITGSLDQVVRGIAEVGDEAKRAGVSLRAFQEWKFVAEQNRIGVDALVDGFKELNLRADEFIVTGQGPAADAFKRIGYGAEGLKAALKDPSELMLEIIDRMQRLDQAAQIRVADEIFGGTAGERFVELLAQGEGQLRQTVQRAHEVGAVMSDEVIAKAAELDRKFGEIATRISNLGKSIVVNVAGAIEDVLTIDIDEIFGSAERAIAMMGQANYDALKAGTALTEEQVGNAETLISTYDELFRTINAATGPDGIRLMDNVDVDIAYDLAAILQDIDGHMGAFSNGKMQAGEFEGAISDLIGEAQDLLSELDDLDAKRFSGVTAAINAIAAALKIATGAANELRQAMPAGGEDKLSYGPPRRGGHRRGSPPRTSARPKARPATTIDMIYGDEPSGGGGGGGARSGRIETLVESLQTESEVLEAWYEESLDLLNSANEAELAAIGGKHEAIQRLEAEHLERMQGIRDLGNEATLAGVLGAGADILRAMGATNRKALKLSQAFAAAEAWVSTLQGAAKELRKGTLGFSTAAAVIAKGVGFVSAIKSVTESGSAGGGVSSPTVSGGTGAEPQGTYVNVQLVGGDMYGPAQMRSFVNALNEAIEDGAQIKGIRTV